VLVGIPIILKAHGEAGAVPIALLLAIHLPVTMTLATLLAEGRNASPAAILRRLIGHPIIVGIIAGSLARPFSASLPEPFWTVVDGLAGAAIPCALISLGIALRRYGLGPNPALPALLGALKLVLHPALVFLLVTWVFAMPPVWASAAVLFAACPCGINAYLFAERYRQGVADASGAIALSTGLAVVTMSFWLAVAGG
jgi:predicted permease